MGQVGVAPGSVKMISTDSLATITTAGYIKNNTNSLGNAVGLAPNDIIECLYDYSTITNSGVLGYFQPNMLAGVITLNAWENPGNVLLPVIEGDFAVFNGTSGQIKALGYSPTDAAKTKVVMAGSSVTIGNIAKFVDVSGTIDDTAGTAVNVGSIQAGLSGTAGVLTSYPATAANGALIVAAVNNSGGNFNTTISNAASVGQAQVISIPDSGAATANFILNKSSASTQTIETGLSITGGANNIQTTGGGNLIAGSSGAAGSVFSYPITASMGSLELRGVDNSGNFDVTIANASHAQASVISIPDGGQATSEFIIADSAGTQHITSGSLQVDAGGLLSGLAAGGTAGSLTLYPVTTANGSMILAPVNAGGAFSTTISNGTMAQSCVYTIPDVTAATGEFIVKTAALVNGNLIQADGTAGVVVDAGVVANRVLYTSFASPDVSPDLVSFDVIVGFASLATGGSVVLITSSGAKQYRIRSLQLNAGGTNFSGGGGDRLGQITDDVTVYSVIPAANLQTLVNAQWGVTELPNPASAAINTATAAGANLVFKYSGGTTDYTAGSLVISGIAERIA